MSHYPCAVIVDPDQVPDGNLIAAVAELMAPYYEGGEWFAVGSRWDWYVLGGRWDGAIRGLDWVDHKETCFTCGGTGTRPDAEQFGPEWMEQTKGCNGCLGTGQQSVWPTDEVYQDPERNICLMAEVSPDYAPQAFVRPTGEWVEQSRVGFFGMEIPDEKGKTKTDKVAEFDQAWAEARQKYPNHLVVGLDCHV